MTTGERLKRAMEAKGVQSGAELARLAGGLKEVTVRAYISGDRNPPLDVCETIGRVLGVRGRWLFDGTPPRERVAPAVESPLSKVTVRGAIGAGGVIETSAEQLDGDGLFEVEVPFTVPEDAIAFEVRGVSMWPRYDDGDVIVCRRQSVDPAGLIGWEAAVGTAEGDRYLKRLLTGSKRGLYRLESHNAPPMEDVRLAWVSDIALVVRANQVRRLDKRSRRKLEKKLSA